MIRLGSFLLLTAAAWAQTPAGRWDGTITVSGLQVPVMLYFEGDGQALKASFVNGDTRTAPGLGSFADGALKLRFEGGAGIEAKLADGALKGTYTVSGAASAFKASAYCTCGYEGEAGPDISGEWTVGSHRMTVRRKGDDTLATVAREGGTVGPLTVRFNGAFFELAYFDGGRAAVAEIEPRKDGSMEVTWKEPGAAVRKATASKTR